MGLNKFGAVVMLAILCSSVAVAQKRQYTMAEAVNGLSGSLAPKGVKGAAWMVDKHIFVYQVDGVTHAYNAETGDTIRSTPALRRWVPGNTMTSKNSLDYQSGDTLGSYYFVDELGKGYGRSIITVLKKGAKNVHRYKSTLTAAYTIDNNIYLEKPATIVDTAMKISGNDGEGIIDYDLDTNIIFGQAVHRNEFGINDGMFFSPNGNYLAYYRMDQTMVTDYPVIDWSTIPAKNENVKYPMAGDASHQVTLRVYNIATKKTIELQTGTPKDHYLTCVTWSPDEKYIYVGILNRGQNHLWLNKYSATTGEKIKTLFEEKSDKYVEPQHPLSFIPGSNTQFIWWSQRDGYMHLWLCDEEKNTIKCLTPGDYVVNELIGFNKRTDEVLITSAKEDPREKHGYAVNWKSGSMRRLDTERGTHTYTASDDGEYLFDVFSSEGVGIIDINPRTGSIINVVVDGSKEYGDYQVDFEGVTKLSVIRGIDGSVLRIILNSVDPLKGYDRPTIQDYTFETFVGGYHRNLYGKLILPPNFDKKRKYPVIVYLYNGPHVQLVKNAFPASGNLWYEYMAQHGYIVWVMDGRGSSNRGLKFEQATFRHLGTVEMEDQLRGVEFLKSLPFVDSTRMGVHGWSFGGFMTTSLMLRHPGVFKVGVAGGPVMDWRMYEIMYGERYMDTPQENPEGYKEAALFDKAKNLKGKLLLIHGTQDATVVWQHSIKFLKASVDQNVQVDYFVYPGYEHNVRGKDRVHLMQKVTDYFDQYLK